MDQGSNSSNPIYFISDVSCEIPVILRFSFFDVPSLSSFVDLQGVQVPWLLLRGGASVLGCHLASLPRKQLQQLFVELHLVKMSGSVWKSWKSVLPESINQMFLLALIFSMIAWNDTSD